MNLVKGTLRRLTPRRMKTVGWLYLLAGIVVIAELAFAYALANQHAQAVQEDTALIKMSGQQNMLSERILLNLHFLEQDTSDTARQDLDSDLRDFAQTHAFLMNHPAQPETVKALLNAQTSGRPINDVVAEFLDRARQFISQPDKEASLPAFTEFVQSTIQPFTRQLANAFEQDAALNGERLHRIWANSIMIAIAILVLEGFVVFLPAQRMIQKSISALEHQTKDLEVTNALLAAEKTKLLSAVAEADALRQEQAEFTYAISHDMKAPANTIKMLHGELCELLEDHPDEDVALFLDMLINTTNRMSHLVEGVLDYTSTLGDAPKMTPVDLSVLCAEIVADLRGDIAEANGQVEIDDLPQVVGNKIQLRMLFQNLISNGIKFRDPNTKSRIGIRSLDTNDNDVAVQITDNGIGIAEEYQDRIFGLFDRLHGQEEYPGTGLGLALCRRIVTNHSGSIELASDLGKGSKFTIHLPKEEAA